MADNQTPVLEPESPYQSVPSRSDNRNIPNCYWRKGPDEADPGWIIVGPGEETRQSDRWKSRGREALPQYSMTDRKSPKTGEVEPIEFAEDGLARFRYYWLFKNGGAKEFTIQQIVEHKWHINPPYGLTVDVFPQMAEYDIPPPLWCAVCPPSKSPFNTPAQIVQHGMIAHQLGIKEARALLEDADEPPPAGGLAPTLRKKSEETPAKKAARKKRGAELVAEAGDIKVNKTLPICNNCGIKIDGPLAEHLCSTG